MFRAITTLLLLLSLLQCSQPTQYDLVIANGRVMDPESGLDGIRNVGIQGETIAEISEGELASLEVLDAAGHVVAPGFIDLHQHGHSPDNYKAQVHDGITTALELEIGVEDIAAWYGERAGKTPVNFGASISHPYSRNLAMLGSNPGLQGEALMKPLNAEQLEQLKERIRRGLAEGAPAVGFGLAYTPGATKEEVVEMFRVAAEHNSNCHVHMRSSTPSGFENIEEVIAASEETGAPLHIVHINSSANTRIPQYLDIIASARKQGADLTTECYPYNRGSTLIQSHLFNDWQTYNDEEFAGYIWVETGETLTRETFGKYREQGGTIISPEGYSEENVQTAVASPVTMIASDGMWLDKGRAHPRSFGTFSRILGRYVREQKALTLMDALRKMSLAPAQRLERRAPMMKKKGRLSIGADADIVVFNPDTVIDKATFENPVQYSEGIQHVVVNGHLTLKDGDLIETATAGKAIKAPSP
jgi:dihydroorotase